VISDPAGISCGATCSTTFDYGTSVALIAAAGTGSTFTGWSGGGCTGTGTCSVTMTAAASVTATFTLDQYYLTVNETGTGSGTVTSPDGISCSATCTTAFDYGTSVALTAAAAPHSMFTGWSGGGCTGTGACSLATNAGKTVTATFTLTPPFTALSPVRVFDSRVSEAQGAVSIIKQRYGGGNVLAVKIAGAADVPSSGVGAVSLNVTVVDPVGSGFVTVFPCGARPNASSLNYVAGQIVANAVIAPLSPAGEVCFFSMVDTDLIADVNGWFPS
jgi:hypothetical protein